MINKAVFLDRDGVINRVVLRQGRPFPPASLKEFKFLPKVTQAIKALRSAGFKIIIVTNQPDVGAGIQSRAVVEAIHARIAGRIVPDGIKVCYHTAPDGCECRKPKPGMLLEAAREWSINLKTSYLVGDRWRDIEAGQAAGCKTVLIKADYKEKKARNPDAVSASLFEASRWILSQAATNKRKNKK